MVSEKQQHVAIVNEASIWGANVRDGGAFDIKNKIAPFNDGTESIKEGEVFKSKYFYYKGFSYKGVPLLRYDDPGNMNYGATGKVFFKMLGDGGLGEFFLEDIAAQGYSLGNNWNQGKGWEWDEERDQASIKFGFYNFQYHVSSTGSPNDKK